MQGTKAIADSYSIRRNAVLTNIPYLTMISAALAAVEVPPENTLRRLIPAALATC